MDFVAKPKLDVAGGLQGYAEEIVTKVKAAARARIRPLARPATPRASLESAAPALPTVRWSLPLPIMAMTRRP